MIRTMCRSTRATVQGFQPMDGSGAADGNILVCRPRPGRPAALLACGNPATTHALDIREYIALSTWSRRILLQPRRNCAFSLRNPRSSLDSREPAMPSSRVNRCRVQ